MSRPKNPNNNYTLVDAVTGETLHTNPKQFNDLVARFGITADELKSSYVGQKGRNKLAADKETVESAIAKYGLHPNVANKLKALRAPVAKTPRVTAVEVTETPTTELEVEVPADSVETVVTESAPLSDEGVDTPVVSGIFEEVA